MCDTSCVNGTKHAKLVNIAWGMDRYIITVQCSAVFQGLDSLGYSHISAEQIALFLKKSDSSHSGDLSLKGKMQ